MSSSSLVRAVMIGCGGMARNHIRQMLKQTATTQITAICEPSPAAYASAAELFTTAGLTPPPNEPDLSRLLAKWGKDLDAAFIITPHAYHHDQTRACLESGLDVLLEKQFVSANPNGGHDAALRRTWDYFEYQRCAVAELG
jgi:predicted dehydrogenase